MFDCYISTSPAAEEICGSYLDACVTRDEVIERARTSEKVRSVNKCSFGCQRPGVTITFNGGVQLCVEMDPTGEYITRLFVDHPRLGEI